MPPRGEVVAAAEAAHWTLDRRVPLALILTVALSTLSIGATAVVAHHRLGSLETRVDRVEASDRQQDRDSAARDRAYAEIMAELRGAVGVLREAVSELRATLRNGGQRP